MVENEITLENIYNVMMELKKSNDELSSKVCQLEIKVDESKCDCGSGNKVDDFKKINDEIAELGKKLIEEKEKMPFVGTGIRYGPTKYGPQKNDPKLAEKYISPRAKVIEKMSAKKLPNGMTVDFSGVVTAFDELIEKVNKDKGKEEEITHIGATDCFGNVFTSKSKINQDKKTEEKYVKNITIGKYPNEINLDLSNFLGVFDELIKKINENSEDSIKFIKNKKQVFDELGIAHTCEKLINLHEQGKIKVNSQTSPNKGYYVLNFTKQ